jgi:DNA-binding MurR/RpiR family transcriptional regulator
MIIVMTTTSCRLRIESKHRLLSNAESKVAHYVLTNYDDVLKCTITELAEKAGSSDASVLRFCRRIGYKGYHEFKIDLARDVIPPYKHLNPRFEPGESTETVCHKIFQSEIETLNETLMVLDMDALEKAAETIAAADRIEIFGCGGSGVVSMDAQHKFLKIGIKTAAHTDTDTQAMSASLLGEGDVAFGISHSGSNRNVTHCLRMAKKQGATTITLSAHCKSPLVKIADIALFTATKETVFKSESVSARIAHLAVIDSLVASVAMKNYERSFKAIQKTRAATTIGKF